MSGDPPYLVMLSGAKHLSLVFVSALCHDLCVCTAPRPLCLGKPPYLVMLSGAKHLLLGLCVCTVPRPLCLGTPPYLVMLSGAKHLSLVFVSALCLDLCVCTVQKILHFVQDDIGEVQCDTSGIVKSLKCLSISLLYG